MVRVHRLLVAVAVAALVVPVAACDQLSKPTGIIERSVAEGTKRYEPLLTQVRAVIDPHIDGAVWKELPHKPAMNNGRCLAVAGEWTAAHIPMRSGLPKTVKASIDPVLTKRGFSTSQVVSTDGGIVQLGSVEPGGASFVLKQSQNITLAVYYATSIKECG